MSAEQIHQQQQQVQAGSAELPPRRHSSLEQLLRQQVQQVLKAADEGAFFAAWDAAGGAPCASLRRRCARLLQQGPQPTPWSAVLASAEALQEVCWERLHTGHWMSVATEWRDAYSLYTMLAVLARLLVEAAAALAPAGDAAAGAAAGAAAVSAAVAAQPQQPQQQQQEEEQGKGEGGPALSSACLAGAMRQLDLAAMMGGPRFRQQLEQLIAALDPLLAAQQQQQHKRTPVSRDSPGTAESPGAGTGAGSLAKRPRLLPAERLEAAAAAGNTAEGQQEQQQQQQEQLLLPPGSLTAGSAVVPVLVAPGLEDFLTGVLLAPGGPQPVVIRGAIDCWPALSRWPDLSYLSRMAGRRTVPVELGSTYMSEGWGSSLMTLDQFMQQHMLADGDGDGSCPAAFAADGGEEDGRKEEGPDTRGAEASSGSHPQQQQPQQQQAQRRPVGYLAQHQLFEQIPALAADISPPDYCALGESGVSSVNAWFGPGGTVTPLHQDPLHNFLAQVVGRKYVRLYDPVHTPRLYPHAEGLHTNTSQVDVGAPDATRFPAFAGAAFVDCVLQPGDLLYLPPRWWHYVKSLSTSFSVSFWWS